MGGTDKHKILIVDDETSNIDALYAILKSEYTILATKKGDSAVSLAEKHVPDLILLDVILPDISGFEVIAALKNSDVTRMTPVIFITGLDSAENEEKGLLLGAVDYITKPFKNPIVKARVKTHIQIGEYINTIDRMCNMDALTGIANRRHFDSAGHTEWDRAIREGTPVGFLILDIDFFKKYNDRYGHPQGDALLKSAASVFAGSLFRPADFVARWGGEEFVVLLPNTDMQGTIEIAERIRGNIEKMVVPLSDGTDSGVTVSIGANSMIPSVGDSFKDFINAADNALYTAKESGRNRVTAVSSI